MNTHNKSRKDKIEKFLQERIKTRTDNLVSAEMFCSLCEKEEDEDGKTGEIYPCMSHTMEWGIINEVNQILLDIRKLR